MESNLTPEEIFFDGILKNTYQTWQQAKAIFSVSHKNLSTELRKNFFPFKENKLHPLSPEIWTILQKRFSEIIAEDWQDARAGIYPYEDLFEIDILTFIETYLKLWLDQPSSWRRMQQEDYQDFPDNINLEKYPNYYRRNFHYQSDGYLSDKSAQLYDLQVELLFNGIADAMRRRILKPLKRELDKLDQDTITILDVACGTGRTLKALRSAFPSVSLYGVDLSCAYLRKANELLSQLPQELPQLLQGKGEELPYQDNYFNAISNVFLFHELPKPIRQQVIDESYRVLQPGGIMVICDSIQLSDSPELEPMINNFSIAFHEPFYTDYVKDDMEEHLQKAGFEVLEVKVCAFSKYWVANKPKD